MRKLRWLLLLFVVLVAWIGHEQARLYAQRSGGPYSHPPNQWKKMNL